MDSLGENLLTFLTTDSLKQIRYDVYQLLKTTTDGVYVYYVTPLSNLNSILSDGGIKCREIIENTTTDLSSHNVQEKRNISLRLARKTSSKVEAIERRLHECVNFFWNPLNDTFRAFQRNALVINPDETDDVYGIVCIIEMKLCSFFQSDKIYWCTSRKNLAADNFCTYAYKFYKDFNWDKIFNLSDERESVVTFLQTNISPLLKEQLAWSAYWLASITRNTNWSEDSFKDIKKTIICGLKACLRNNILMTSRIHSRMRMNCRTKKWNLR